jgi:hypothetical protein
MYEPDHRSAFRVTPFIESSGTFYRVGLQAAGHNAARPSRRPPSGVRAAENLSVINWSFNSNADIVGLGAVGLADLARLLAHCGTISGAA